MVNDGINHAARQRYALENITAPTLVIDSADIGTYAGARYNAEHIPGAKFIGFKSGGHPAGRPVRRSA
jgi:pimeloyl-ACP methyl ester carboxylesterase